MNEADLVKIRGALERATLLEAIRDMEKVLEELGYRKSCFLEEGEESNEGRSSNTLLE